MCALLTASKTSREEKKSRRINRKFVTLSPSILMKKKAEPKRNVPSGIIF